MKKTNPAIKPTFVQRSRATLSPLIFLVLCLVNPVLVSTSLAALAPLPSGQSKLDQAALDRSIVSLQISKGGKLLRQGSGFVVQADRFNGYIVSNASLVRDADALSVTIPQRGGQLVAQVLRSDLANDYALLKVNGLDLPTLEFAAAEPANGEVVWSANKASRDAAVTVSKGLLRNAYRLSDTQSGWYQHTAGPVSSPGGVLLNECGQVVGLNFAQPAGDNSIRALDLKSLSALLAQQNVRFSQSTSACISDVVQAQQQAEQASAAALAAKDEASRAQAVARDLEQQLTKSNQNSDSLVRETRLARERADAAIAAAELARARAENTRRELEEKTTVLREETQILLRAFEEDRLETEARFQDLLAIQQQAANSRERILIGLSGVLIVIIGMVLFLARQRSGSATAKRQTAANQEPGSTVMHRGELAEYVLDGRDDDGIRYLLRISGDQLTNQEDGVIIGRNPKDSPYIINHADVSRKHARIKVRNKRVFIEDLGSTNGTSVNGQSIDDKGLVSVSSGDQIIIGSVVMKLRVMEG